MPRGRTAALAAAGLFDPHVDAAQRDAEEAQGQRDRMRQALTLAVDAALSDVGLRPADALAVAVALAACASQLMVFRATRGGF